MAAEIQSADSPEKVIPNRVKKSISELFIPKDTLHQPCDVVLLVKDGKQFKAHRRVLSEASPFFENLLNSNMKEAQEGVVWLEMFTESVMVATLQFIYTGDVQISTEDTARELIVVADYLFLEKLKLLAAEVLVQTLNASNCISTYYFAERYQCEFLLSSTWKFVLAHFTSIYAANREDVLNMSSKEVEMLISSDEIAVSAEEDVYKLILAWVDHDGSRRIRYLWPFMYDHVRFEYVSPDFLRNDILTSKRGRLLLRAEVALQVIENKDCIYPLRAPPRRSLETSASVINVGSKVLCYFPRENSWYQLTSNMRSSGPFPKFVPCDGQLRSFTMLQYYPPQSYWQTTYNPYSNRWTDSVTSFQEHERYLRKTFGRNEDEMYALMTEQGALTASCQRTRTGTEHNCDNQKFTSFLMKYKPESNLWEEVSSFDHLGLRDRFCIVANDNFIYFIGGKECSCDESAYLTSVDRYNLSKNQWEKAADIQMARSDSSGAAANEKIYIAGSRSLMSESCQCEVYDETTNEWQFITSFGIGLSTFGTLVSVNGELYATSAIVNLDRKITVKIKRYYPEENKWETKTELTAERELAHFPPEIVCSMRIFKGLSNIRKVVEAIPSESLPTAITTQPLFCSEEREGDEDFPSDSVHGSSMTQPSLTAEKCERKCFII